MDETVTQPALDIEEAAKKLFDEALPEDPFSENQPEPKSGGEEPEGQEPEPTGDDDTDAEAVEALEPEAEEEEESDEPEDDEPEDGPEPEPAETEAYTVKVDGEEVAVTLDELRAGYSRTASWTRKSQALAQERKAFEQESQAVRAEREKYAAMLGTLEQQLQAQMPQPPKTDDPREWVRFQQETQRLEAVQAEQQAIQTQMKADWEAERARVADAENQKLTEFYPEWKDESVALAAKADLVSYATGLGFDTDELSNVYDHRVVLLLAKAKAYDELEAQKTVVKKKTAKAPVLKPGQPRGRSRSTKARKKSRSQRDRLRESGKVDDAAAVLFNAIDDE